MDRDDLLGGDFENADLMGLNGAEDLLGRIGRLPKDKQARALLSIIKGKSTVSKKSNSRTEFQEKWAQLPASIQSGLENQRLQLVDTRFYIVKDIAGKQSIDVFQGTDNKNVGLANIASQKLEKDNWFILSAIRVMYAESLNKETADFGLLPPVILNGEFELEAGQKKIFGLTTNEIFDTKTRVDLPIGLYKLDSTKLIEPQVEIKMPIKFAASANPNAFLKVVLIGSSTVPY